MKLTFHCKACRTQVSAPVEHGGEVLSCPSCGRTLRVPLSEGKMVAGYRIIRRLGAGGMGSVYLAEQEAMKREVALKILDPALTDNEMFRVRFEKEIQLHAALHHPRIAIAYDAGHEGSLYYLAMEFVKGQSLDQWIKASGLFSERQALRIIRGVAVGLSYAWKSSGLIHRDIKPSNIMISQDGTVKILDMGVSTTVDPEGADDPKRKFVLGTPQYMPPEQMRDHAELDHRADMFALGATLYFMLLGRPPYEEETVEEIVEAQKKDLAPNPRSIRPEISASCVHLIRVMMAKKPENRYLYWSSLNADISRVLSGQKPITRAPDKDESFVAPASVSIAVETSLKLPPKGKSSNSAATKPSPKRGKLEQVGFVIFIAVIWGLFALVWMGRSSIEAQLEERKSSDSVGRPEVIQQPAGPSMTEQAEAAFASLLRVTEESPADFDRLENAVARFRAEAEKHRLEEFVQRADDLSNTLIERKKKAEDDVIHALSEKAEALWADGRYRSAENLWRAYKGPLSEETRLIRTEQESIYRERNQQRVEAKKKKAQQGEEAIAQLRETLIEQLVTTSLSEEWAASLREVEERFSESPQVQTEAAKLRDMYTGVSDWRSVILASFREHIGTEQELQTEKGRISGQVMSVTNGLIHVQQPLENGFVERDIHIDELTRDELIARLKDLNSVQAKLALGGLALEEGLFGVAQKAFADVPGEVGPAVARQLKERQQPDPQPDIAKKPSGEPPLVRALKQALKERNPGYTGGGEFRVDGKTITAINLLGDVGELRDLSPLKYLPLTFFGVQGGGIRDLSPLRGMPLKALVLVNTGVSSLTPLEGMELTRLSLEGSSNVTSLASCEGMPLRSLDIRGTKVQSLKPISQASITSLKVGSAFNRTDEFEHFPLTHLDISNTRIRSLTGLRKQELQSIFFVNTRVEDVTPLGGMPLRQIRFNPQWVRRGLSLLREMPTLTRLADSENGEFISPVLFWGRLDSGFYTNGQGDKKADKRS